MYSPKAPKPSARPMILPTRMTPKMLAEKRAAIRRLQGYQFGAYDDSSEAVAFDQQQDFFSGLEAERGKKRAAESAMWGRRGQRGGTRYSFLDGMDNEEPALDMQQDQFGFAPLTIVAPVAGLIRGSSTGSSNAATDRAAVAARMGDPSGLAFIVQQGGFTSNGGWRGAVGKGADAYARSVLNSLITDGVVIGPL